MDAHTPVIVGVGQVTNRRERIVEPMDLMEEAARRAAADAGADLLPLVGSVQIVSFITFSYPDPPGLLAQRLGIPEGERILTTAGGNTPQWLVARACDQISRGEVDCALIAGAEALDSIRQAQAKGVQVNRGDRNAAPPSNVKVIGDMRTAVSAEEIAARLMAPVQIYPLYESALAHRDARTFEEQRAFVGKLMSPFTKVAASHPDTAWFPVERAPDEIATPGPDNRFITEPYVKLMNAIMQVDQGAALLLMSAGAAEAAGVAKDRWVFPWASAECTDVFVTAQRPDMTRSPAIEAAGRKVFDAAGVSVDDLSSIDIYSCFPCAVEISAHSLGIAEGDPRGLTVTGGLPYFGGPGNNYTTHSIAYTVERCRSDPDAIGLCTANGWYITKHAVGLYSATPPANGWQHPSCAEEQAQIDASALQIASDVQGTATVEAFTVQHDRTGPVAAPLFARLSDGRRVVAAAADPSLPASLTGKNLVGEKVRVRPGQTGMVYEP